MGTLKLCSERDLTDTGLRPAHAGRIVAALRPPAPAHRRRPRRRRRRRLHQAWHRRRRTLLLGGGLRSLLDDAPPAAAAASLRRSGELPADFGALLPGLGALGLNATPQPQRSALAELRDGDDGAVCRLAAPSSSSAPRVNGGAPPPPEPKPRAGPSPRRRRRPRPRNGRRPRPRPKAATETARGPLDAGPRAIHQRPQIGRVLRARAAPRRPRHLAGLGDVRHVQGAEPSAFALVWWAHHGAEVRGPSGSRRSPRRR